jgi:hypothetical protein
MFTLCHDFNVRLNPGKCVIFSKTVRWCGRLISAEGAKFDAHRIQGLLDMPPPSTGVALQQFSSALNWMRTAIPSFPKIVSPLHSLLEAVHARTGGKWTKTAAAHISLSTLGWTAERTAAFTACQTALAHATSLAHPSQSKRVYILRTYLRNSGQKSPPKYPRLALICHRAINATSHSHFSLSRLRVLCAGGS